MRMRAKANYDFEKDFYKLMNNSVFGETIENIWKRQNVAMICYYLGAGREVDK